MNKDVTMMSVSTVSYLAQLDSNSLPIECFPLTEMAVSLELTDTS